ncbi:MAG TPA: hypothetical protein VLY46_11140 [Usitatibacter sp.]|nr:hypothetical protein [Usitatibacter sp.]
MDHRKLAASLAASLLVASSAMAAAPEPMRIASEFASWAGSRQNAEALVHGLHNGTSVALATTSPDRRVSLAGFTPGAPMSFEEVREALAAARSSLARLGVRQPDAEQIQAALIGGEVRDRGGRTRMLPGTVAVLGGNPNVASR